MTTPTLMSAGRSNTAHHMVATDHELFKSVAMHSQTPYAMMFLVTLASIMRSYCAAELRSGLAPAGI